MALWFSLSKDPCKKEWQKQIRYIMKRIEISTKYFNVLKLSSPFEIDLYQIPNLIIL